MNNDSLEKFNNGWWTAWLCGFAEGEKQTHVIEDDKVKAIRAIISRLVKDGMYFTTKYSLGVLKVERITFEKWMESKSIV